MRFLFYSHDSYGLGHLRRSISIADRLLEQCPGASVLIATGSPVATRFKLRRGIDILKLPSVTKGRGGGYESHGWDMDLEELLALRSDLLTSAVRGFQPRVMLVDHKPCGLLGELRRAFDVGAAAGVQFVLGIRDIIDHADAVSAEWGTPDVQGALGQLYDRIMIYGDRNIFDASVEYPALRGFAKQLEFVGYVVSPPARPGLPPLALLRPHAVVTVGGGQDGAARIDAYLDAVESQACPWSTSIILGPLFEGDAGRRVKARVAGLTDVSVSRTHDDMPGLFRDASAVVAMAGYNTCAEILQARVPAVLMPRVIPRQEQLIRTERLAELGFVQHAHDPSPAELVEKIAGAIEQVRVRRPLPAMDGARRAASVLLSCAGIESEEHRLRACAEVAS